MKYNKEFYLTNPAFVDIHVAELQKTMSSTGWELMLSYIDELIEAWRTELETAPVERLKEIQYGILNLKNLKSAPEDLIKQITSFSSPPQMEVEKMEFNYQ